MGDPPDYLFRVRSRAYAAVPLALAGGVAAVTAAVPALYQDREWVADEAAVNAALRDRTAKAASA